MGLAPPRLEDLPECFPVFPLAGALLLPRGRLPLNIFEPRYLAMIEDALGAGRLFGMIQPDRCRPCGPTGPALYRVGCLGRISAFSETEDGRYLVTLTGVIRYIVAEEIEMRRGYRRVRGAFGRFAADLVSPEPDSCCDRAGLVSDLRRYFSRCGIDANWEAVEAMTDASLVATLCMVCPFDVAEKQALLEAPTDAERAATLRALLTIASHAGRTSGPSHAT
jgi:Lon protease-like protein